MRRDVEIPKSLIAEVEEGHMELTGPSTNTAVALGGVALARLRVR